MKQTAERFFDACETGKGWDGCRQYCHDSATFSTQAGALAGVSTVQQYADWMRGLFTPVPDGSYEIRSVQNQVHAWPWHQHGQPKELHRVEHDVCRPIGPRLPQREAHLAVARLGEPLGRPCRNDEPRMQVQPMPAGMTRAGGSIDRRTRVSETTHART